LHVRTHARDHHHHHREGLTVITCDAAEMMAGEVNVIIFHLLRVESSRVVMRLMIELTSFFCASARVQDKSERLLLHGNLSLTFSLSHLLFIYANNIRRRLSLSRQCTGFVFSSLRLIESNYNIVDHLKKHVRKALHRHVHLAANYLEIGLGPVRPGHQGVQNGQGCMRARVICKKRNWVITAAAAAA